MTVTNEFSEQAILESWKGEIDLENDTLKAILMVPAFTFNQATHATYADVSASEVSSNGGYVVGGVALTNVAVSIDAGVIMIDCDNISFTAVGGAIDNAGGLLVYDDTHANDTVIVYIDYGDGVYYSTATGTTHLIDCSNGLAKATPNPSES